MKLKHYFPHIICVFLLLCCIYLWFRSSSEKVINNDGSLCVIMALEYLAECNVLPECFVYRVDEMKGEKIVVQVITDGVVYCEVQFYKKMGFMPVMETNLPKLQNHHEFVGFVPLCLTWAFSKGFKLSKGGRVSIEKNDLGEICCFYFSKPVRTGDHFLVVVDTKRNIVSWESGR